MDKINEAYQKTINEGFLPMSKHPQGPWMYPVMSHRGAFWADFTSTSGGSGEVAYAPDGGQGDGRNVIVVTWAPAKGGEMQVWSVYDVKDLKGTAKKLVAALSKAKDVKSIAKKFNLTDEMGTA